MDPLPMEHHTHSVHHLSNNHHHDLNGLTSLGGHEGHEANGGHQLQDLDQEREVKNYFKINYYYIFKLDFFVRSFLLTTFFNSVASTICRVIY